MHWSSPVASAGAHALLRAFTAQGPQSETPSIDALASGGIVLLSSYAYRYCSPSRAAFLTGRLPYHVHESNPGISTRGCTNLNYTMIPAKLRAAGYTSFQVGKWHQGLEAEACLPLGRGFDHSFGYLSGAVDHVDQTAPVCPSCKRASGVRPTGFGCVDLWRDRGPAWGENGTYNGYLFPRQAVAYIEGARDMPGPIFLFMAFQEVHGPYEVPPRFRERFPPDPQCGMAADNPTCCGVTGSGASNITSRECIWEGRDGVCKCDGGITGFQPRQLVCPPGAQCTREYMLGMLSSLDAQIETIVKAIKENGFYDNSVIVFSSDNGGAVAGAPQHGSMNNYPLRGGKSAYFEGGIRTASFVHSPLLPPHSAGTVAHGVVSIADWYSTFCFLAGVPSEDQAGEVDGHESPAPFGNGTFPVDSVNLWPWLSGTNKTAPREELLLGKAAGGALIGKGGWKVIFGQQNPDWWYGSYSPNCTGGDGAHANNCDDGCLFHIESDAGEHVNLKNDYPLIFARLRDKLESAEAVVKSGTDDMFGDGAACKAMETTWRGFFGPFVGVVRAPKRSPPPAPYAGPPYL